MEIDSNYFKIRLFAFDFKEVGSWWNFKGHISPFARIFVIRKGTQTVTFDGKEYKQRANHVALVPPYTPVDYYCKNYCEQFYFIFTCQLPNGRDLFADFTFPWLMKAEPWQLNMSEYLIGKYPHYGLQNVDADTDDFNRSILEATSQSVNLEQKLAAQGLVAMLLSSFANGVEERVSSVRFVKTFQYIEENLKSDLSLGVLAELEGLSISYFSDQFFLYAGVRPSEYIAQKRENRARDLLTTTNLPLADVAVQIGFPDISYFFRFFKKRTGVTPRSYRNRHR